jgi:hypothetical protein
MSNASSPPLHEVSLKVSAHDRVSSFIVAMLYLVGCIVFLLFLLWLTTRATTATQQIEVEYLPELLGGEPALGEGRDFEEPGAEDIQDLATPDAEQLLAAVTDVASFSQASENTMGQVSKGMGAGDRRKAGEGGDVSVPRWERWEVRFTSTSLTRYAEQLQSFGIELAAAGGGREQVDYASALTQTKPTSRTAPGNQEKRLYMSYRSGQLKAFDEQLLRRAGIPTQGRTLLQFYPRQVEATLASLERKRAGNRPMRDVLKTVFSVKKSGPGYRFEVIEQQYH